MGSAPAVYPAPRAGTGSEQPRASLSQGGLFVLGLVLVLLGMGAGVAIGAAVWAGGPSGPSVGFHISPSPRFGGGGGGPFGRGGPFGGQIPALPNSGSGGPSSIFRGFGLGTTGTVTAVNGNTVTVKTSNGRTFNVNVPSSATVTTTQNGSLSNVTSGSCIRVTGSGVRVTPGGSNSGNSGSGNSGTGSSGSGSSTGSLTARSVEVLPSGSADCSS